jgi:hypothetical protein
VIESNIEPRNNRRDIRIIEVIDVPEVWIVSRDVVKNGAKRVEVIDVKKRLQHRAPSIAIKCF